MLQAGRSRVRFPLVLLEFFIDIILPAALWPSGRSASNRNISWGNKGGRCVGLTLPPSCAECFEIWEPQLTGTLGVCPGLSRDCFTFLYHSHKNVSKCFHCTSTCECSPSSEHFLVLHSITVTYSSLLPNVLLYMLYKTPYIHYVLVSHLCVFGTNLLCHLWSTLRRV